MTDISVFRASLSRFAVSRPDSVPDNAPWEPDPDLARLAADIRDARALADIAREADRLATDPERRTHDAARLRVIAKRIRRMGG